MQQLVRVICVFAAATSLFAQRGEVGGGGGGSIFMSKTVTAPGGTADAGFQQGFAVAGWIGHYSGTNIGGEIRYMFQRNDLKLAAGGTKATFTGHSHAIHYDVLVYGTSSEYRLRPYVIVGGGIKGYFGTGREAAFQPLSNFALLTRTRQWQPLVSGGAGVKVAMGSGAMVRVEFRDYVTPFPKDVITPAPGAKISGWLHNFVPLVGISWTF